MAASTEDQSKPFLRSCLSTGLGISLKKIGETKQTFTIATKQNLGYPNYLKFIL